MIYDLAHRILDLLSELVTGYSRVGLGIFEVRWPPSRSQSTTVSFRYAYSTVDSAVRSDSRKFTYCAPINWSCLEGFMKWFANFKPHCNFICQSHSNPRRYYSASVFASMFNESKTKLQHLQWLSNPCLFGEDWSENKFTWYIIS